MLQFLFSPTKQFLYDSGKLLAGGKIYVYLKDTQNLATLYDGETGDVKSNPIILDANGRASVKADDVNEYRLEIYTPYDTLVYTCNSFYTEGGEGGGTFIVRHDDTLSGNGTSQNLLGVVNIPLAVDDTMTAYTDIVEGVSSLVLGVNGDWFNDTFGSALDNKVDLSSFSACCSSVKEELKNKLDTSSFDLRNYYNKQETNNLFENYYNKQEIDETVNVINELKQDKLTFDYNENSAISAINGSALAGQGGESGYFPWISGGKEIANTQTLTGDMIVQVLSSFTLSGDHNHFISVKGGVYRFPNRYEIASSIAETNYFMPQSSMSGYLPMSTFSSYTASIQNNLETNWNYTNSAYSLSINNFHNKLDISAFSAWSAVQEPVLIGDSNITAISSKVDSHTQWNLSVNAAPVITDTRLVGDNCVTAHTTETSGEWIVGLVQSAYEAINSVSGIATDVDTLKNASGNYYPMTGNPSGFLTAHQIIPSSKWEDASNTVQTNSAQWAENTGDTAVNLYVYNNSAINNEVNNVVTANSADWNTVTGKLDYSAFTAYTGEDNTYLLVGGYNIGVSSDDNEKTTTISYTGANGDTAVNNVVHSYSSTWNDITVYQSHSGDYITAHQIIPSAKWENASDVVQTNSAQWGNGGDSYNVLTSNSGLWNAVYDLVATYSAKWLINGDV